MQLGHKLVQPGSTTEQGPHDSELLGLHHHLSVVHISKAFRGHPVSLLFPLLTFPLSSPALPRALLCLHKPCLSRPTLSLTWFPTHEGLWSLGHPGHRD